MNLEKSAESFIEQMPSAHSASLMRREKSIERFGNFALGGLGAVATVGVAALLWVLISKFLLTGTNVFVGILLTAFVIFAFLSLIFVVLNENSKERKAKINPVLSDALGEAKKETGKLLEEKPLDFIPSVTENSTELLLVENKTRKIK